MATRLLGVAAGLAAASAADVAWARCPMCRSTLVASVDGPPLAANFNDAILFLLAVPFAIAAAFVVWIVRAVRRARRDTG